MSERDNKKLFVYFQNNNGCGGACETEQVWVSEQPLTENYYASDANTSQRSTTPAAEGWAIYKSVHDHYYLLSIVHDREEVYEVAAPKRWHLSCAVTLAPEHLQQSDNPSVKEAVAAIKALDDTVAGMAGGAGDCGSMRTAGRWRYETRETLYQTLYRPWAIVPFSSNPPSENSYGDYSRIWPSLVDWSLGGLSEHRTLGHYQTQLSQTTQVLARFYKEHFGWSVARANDTAHESLINAVSHNFGFYMYSPHADADLRQAILEHMPMATIRSIALDVVSQNQPGAETVLNVAIEYPEALQYLLAKGLDPNVGNAFGKTPLMYAAQDNQLEATKLLLKAGADPNAGTTASPDRCSYTLETTYMTPLHYAARYASGALIRLLVDNGATTFSKAQNALRSEEYPLDWLRRYTAESATSERNTNIGSSEISATAELLRVPSDAERGARATTDVATAESAYAAGKFDSAYRTVRTALAAQPDNPKALADLPLMALKDGQLGPAMVAANRAIAALTEPSGKAAAWFNKGLACEQVPKTGLQFNGEYYCQGDRVLPFLRAWQLQATPARATKLLQLLQEEGPGTCVVPRSGTTSQRFRLVYDAGMNNGRYEQVERVYALHRADETIDPGAIQWTVQYSGAAQTTTETPHLVGRYTLNENAVTVLEAQYFAKPATIYGHLCKLD